MKIPAAPEDAEVRAGGRTVRLTNLSKPFWPELGLTKRDLVRYYAEVAEVLLPHLAGRAMVMKRYPSTVCDASGAAPSGDRSGMRKIKFLRTADCVVGGFRYSSDSPRGASPRTGAPGRRPRRRTRRPRAAGCAAEEGRFRHGTRFLRWRPDKAPRQCTLAQVKQESGVAPMKLS